MAASVRCACALSAALAAREFGIKAIAVRESNAREAANVGGVDVFALKSLPQAVDLVNAPESVQPDTWMRSCSWPKPPSTAWICAMCASNRPPSGLWKSAAPADTTFCSSPGAGKTMVAKRIPTILPPMSLDEAIETTRIHSVSGLLEDSRGLVGTRPFRSPHHTISDAGSSAEARCRGPARSPWATTACFFSTSCPSFSATFWRSCASHSRMAGLETISHLVEFKVDF